MHHRIIGRVPKALKPLTVAVVQVDDPLQPLDTEQRGGKLLGGRWWPGSCYVSGRWIDRVYIGDRDGDLNLAIEQKISSRTR
jgi:hypothetical protein